MEPSLPDGTTRARRPGAAWSDAGPVLALVFAGLLSEVVDHEGASAGIDYGLHLLALLGAAGCIASFAGRFSSNLDSSLRAGASLIPRPAAALPDGRERGEDWPVLVALLFGAVVGLISGLGGWV